MSALRDEISYRRKLADALGSPEERKRLRQRLGLSVEDVAAMVGLSPAAIRWRESARWRHSRGSLDSPAGLRYAELIMEARGKLNQVSASK
jgi:transcriptional regulator with XRE-family HTH domain